MQHEEENQAEVKSACADSRQSKTHHERHEAYKSQVGVV